MLGEIRGTVRFKEPLSFYTSLRTGGTADVFIVPQDLDDVRHALSFADRQQMPVLVLGSGNKVLVRDSGVRGVVLRLEGCLSRADFQGEEAMVGAGMGLSHLVRHAAAHELGGIEPLVGIPATVGGALATNAGTADGWIGDYLSAVYFLYPDGTLGEYKPGPGPFTERRLEIPSGTVTVGCRLRLQRRSSGDIQKDIKQRLKQKNIAQPLALAAAGPIWKDPPGASASRLIERAGLRGKRVGAAEISAKAPNYVINRGGASAVDVLRLMELSRERVRTQFHVTLVEDIKVLGE
ncbi:MAG TPA: FAD-binding protein [Terriglobales bacterium]|nr:FAD-binding protein [Terriglobales bacterium]